MEPHPQRRSHPTSCTRAIKGWPPPPVSTVDREAHHRGWGPAPSRTAWAKHYADPRGGTPGEGLGWCSGRRDERLARSLSSSAASLFEGCAACSLPSTTHSTDSRRHGIIWGNRGPFLSFFFFPSHDSPMTLGCGRCTDRFLSFRNLGRRSFASAPVASSRRAFIRARVLPPFVVLVGWWSTTCNDMQRHPFNQVLPGT